MYNGREMKRIQPLLLFGMVLALLLTSVAAADAARLYYDAPEAVPYGESFLVPLRIDVEGECINAIEATLTYSSNTLEAVTFTRGPSIFSLWPEPPTIEEGAGRVSFAGGIPGGYCGPIMGDTSGTNVIGELALRTLPNEGAFEAVTEGTLGFTGDTQVLLHDGFGTQADVAAEPVTFSIRETGELPRDRYQELLEGDTIPPEPFEVYLNTNTSVFGGDAYIVFSTTDKQSGIDYYEVYESDADGNAPGTKKRAAFVRAEGGEPYRLADQSGQSAVVVRAYDKAGNVREVALDRETATPPPEGLSKLEAALLGGIAAAIAVLLLALAWAMKRRRIIMDKQGNLEGHV